MLTDTHCHLDLDQFAQDRPDVIKRAQEAGVERILIPALNLTSCRSVLNLAASQANLFAAMGVHPTEAASWEPGTRKALIEFYNSARAAKANKLVAIGEIGLDYYWDSSTRELQQNILKEQLDLAGELGLPVILHCREQDDDEHGACADDLIRLLSDWHTGLVNRRDPLASLPGVWHSFSGRLASALLVIDLNFLIGVTGPVTYRNAHKRQEIIHSLPLDRLLLETDAPYQAPHPVRGKRNEPAFIVHIADKIAEIHMTTRAQVAALTSINASRLFGWGG